MSITLPPVAGEISLAIFASDCHFATAVVELLASSGITISTIVLPGHPSLDAPLSVQHPGSPLVMSSAGGMSLGACAARLRIPVYRAGRLDTDTWQDHLHGIAPDLLLSVCFPRLIPPGIIAAVDNMALNVHPSLLPDLRGPDPIFWTFRRATGETGLSLHVINERFDAGPIVAQLAATYEPGTREAELERMHAQMTLQLLAGVLPGVTSNTLFGLDQDDDLATWAPNPAANDYVIDRTWDAIQAFTFVRGVEDRGHPVTLAGGNSTVRIRRAYGHIASLRELDESSPGTPVELHDGYLIADIVPDYG